MDKAQVFEDFEAYMQRTRASIEKDLYRDDVPKEAHQGILEMLWRCDYAVEFFSDFINGKEWERDLDIE